MCALFDEMTASLALLLLCICRLVIGVWHARDQAGRQADAFKSRVAANQFAIKNFPPFLLFWKGLTVEN